MVFFCQANEENLRLLRESLATIKIDWISDVYIALTNAFEILERFRIEQRGKTRFNKTFGL